MDEIVCDLLVVGSGASGFATALTARHLGLDILMVEKEPVFGGTTCFSAGVIWVPSSSPARQAQIEDSDERALCYLKQEAGNRLNETIASSYLTNAPRMLNFFTAGTHVRFDLLSTMPDYHPEASGGVGGGRSLRPRVFDGRRLGTWFEKLRPPIKTMTIFGGMMVGSADLPHLQNVTRSTGIVWRRRQTQAIAQQIGGAFDDNVHHHVAWTPVSLVPQPDGSKIGFPHFNDRAKPGFIVVDKEGRRFANESASYHETSYRT